MQVLGESLGELEKLARVSKNEFMKNKGFQDLTKWYFYVTIQGCLDLGSHIISIKGYDLPECYEDIVLILKRKEIISKKLAVSLQGMAGFRNLIAHSYFKIDLNKLYSYLKKLNEIKRFIRRLEPYI